MALLGKEITITASSSQQIVWRVGQSSVPVDPLVTRHDAYLGIRGLNLSELPTNAKFAQLFLHLLFSNWRESLQLMNDSILKFNRTIDDTPNVRGFRRQRKVRLFSGEEFLVGFALLIGAAGFGDGRMWKGKRVGKELQHRRKCGSPLYRQRISRGICCFTASRPSVDSFLQSSAAATVRSKATRGGSSLKLSSHIIFIVSLLFSPVQLWSWTSRCRRSVREQRKQGTYQTFRSF